MSEAAVFTYKSLLVEIFTPICARLLVVADLSMKFSVAVFVAVLCALAAAEEEKYTNRFDTIDIDKVLNSERLLNNYHKCLMERGPCTPAGAELKSMYLWMCSMSFCFQYAFTGTLPDALQTDCAKCTQKQRDQGIKVNNFLLTKKPKMFKELEAKYDPDGKYRAREAARKAKLDKKE